MKPVRKSEPGADKFLRHLQSIHADSASAQVGLEATGHYWLSLYSFLVAHGYRVFVINPYQSDAWRKVYLSSVKTDKEDAFLIADILRFGSFTQTHVPDEAMIALRNLTRFRVAVCLQMTDTKRRILTVLDQVFPEFAALFSTVFGKTATTILETYSTPEALESLSERKLTNLVSRLSRGRFGKEKAQAIKDAARTSFGVIYALDSFTLQLKLLLKQLELLSGQLEDLDCDIARRMDAIPSTLTSIPGIGTGLAAAIHAEIGDIKRFRTSSQLISFAGINPTVRQSGNFTGTKNRMSKKGSPYLRLALWRAAVVASWANPILKAFYEQKLKEGKHPMTAYGAVARKLTGIIFALLRDNKSFVV
ncbi:IS110 family transposase [Candidatus Gottesmanbacteria bacterium]|nr:IS110 family transposase [Candidatus Gottesmanbacteria bacterium]